MRYQVLTFSLLLSLSCSYKGYSCETESWILDARHHYRPGPFELLTDYADSTYSLPFRPYDSPIQCGQPYNETLNVWPRKNISARDIPGQDGRRRITNTTEWPYLFHSQLSLRFDDKDYGGSGVLVGPHHLLTSAHNVYNRHTKQRVTEITARLALNDDTAPFGKLQATQVYTFKNWVMAKNESRAAPYNMALIVLEQSIGRKTGWCGLLCAQRYATLLYKQITITGYPEDKDFKQMWVMNREVRYLEPEQLFYQIDSHTHHSGGGICINQWGHSYVIGIHTLRTPSQQYINDYGMRLSQDKIKAIHKWIQDTYTIGKPTAAGSSSSTDLAEPGTLVSTLDIVHQDNNNNSHGSPVGMLSATNQDSMAQVIQQLQQDARFLRLGRVNLAENNFDQVVNYISAHKLSLTQLDLSHNVLTPQHLQLLSRLPQLTTLDVSATQLTPEGLNSLPVVAPNLTTLRAGHNPALLTMTASQLISATNHYDNLELDASLHHLLGQERERQYSQSKDLYHYQPQIPLNQFNQAKSDLQNAADDARFDQGFKLMQKLANQGYKDAQYTLGHIFANFDAGIFNYLQTQGLLTTADPLDSQQALQQAEYWYKLAADQVHKGAARALARLYEDNGIMVSIPRGQVKDDRHQLRAALNHYRMAQRAGDTRCYDKIAALQVRLQHFQ